MEKIWGRYEELRPDSLDAIKTRHPTAILPWGAIEWHSHHNPVGLDGLVADGLSTSLAARIGGVVLPAVYLGTETIKSTLGFPHTVDFPPYLVTLVALQFLHQLADERFEQVIIISGHFANGHVRALRDAIDQFQSGRRDCGVVLLTPYMLLEGDFEMNHAAFGETSLQMAFNASLVDLTRLPTDRLATLEADGVWGRDPREATREAGVDQARLFVDRAVAMIEAGRGDGRRDKQL